MKFNFEGNTYKFELIDAELLDDSHDVKEYGFDGENKFLMKADEHFLYYGKFREPQTGVVLSVQKGVVVDHLNKDWYLNDQDTIEDFDYSECTPLYHSDDFDDDEFDALFREEALKELADHCRNEINNDKLEAISEALKVDTSNVADILEDVKSRKQEEPEKVEEPKRRSKRRNNLR